MSTIGEIIKTVRKEQRLTQKVFAKSLSVGQPYVSRIEKNFELPSNMFIRLFSLVYSVDENSILSIKKQQQMKSPKS